MSADPILTGFRFSVYTRAAKMALAAKGVACLVEECNPFDEKDAAHLLSLHPFGRVPALEHDGFCLYETQAILDYVDAVFDGPALTPDGVQARARMRQVMSIADSYLYWPLVRQAFSHAVFRPLMGEEGDEDQVEHGLEAAPRVLDALEEIAQEGLVLVPDQLCLASCHLWPMLDYFRMIPEGAGMLSARPALARWSAWIADTQAAKDTKPDLPEGEAG